MSLPTLKEGSTGAAVRALQDGLNRLGYGPLTVDGGFGAFTGAAVRRFQGDHGLGVDGVVGPITWAAITRAIGGSPIPQPGPDGEATIRAAIVKAARYAIANEPAVHYATDGRRMGWVRAWKRPASQRKWLPLPAWEDCSSAITGLYCVAGAPDPNGRGYDGGGYTGTMLSAMTPTTRAAARIGDLAVYGPGDGAHVGLVLARGGDPLLFSHGSERGPHAVAASLVRAAFPKPVRWLTLPGW